MVTHKMAFSLQVLCPTWRSKKINGASFLCLDALQRGKPDSRGLFLEEMKGERPNKNRRKTDGVSVAGCKVWTTYKVWTIRDTISDIYKSHTKVNGCFGCGCCSCAVGVVVVDLLLVTLL